MNGVRYIFVSMTFLHLTTASRLPGQPTDVTLLADSKNIAVQWQAPLRTGGNIRKYIVTWAILPKCTDVRSAIVVDGDVMVAIISVQMDIGRLFRVRVRAENEAGVGPYSSPRYIRIDETDNKGDIVASVVSTVVTVIIVICLTAVVCLWMRRRARWKVHEQADSKYRQTRVELHDILLQFSPFYPQPSATRTRRSSFPCCYSVRKSKMLASRVEKSFSVMGCIEDRETLKQRLERLHRRQRINSV